MRAVLLALLEVAVLAAPSASAWDLSLPPRQEEELEEQTGRLGSGRPLLRIDCPGLRYLTVLSILKRNSIPHDGVRLVKQYDEIADPSSPTGDQTNLELAARRIGLKPPRGEDEKHWALPLTVRDPRRGGECLAAGIIVMEIT